MSAVSQIASRTATRDRGQSADLVLDAAVKVAVGLIRSGRADKVAWALERAGRSAARILGERA